MPRKTKQFWIWVGILLLVELAAITMWKRWYWFFPSHAVSEAYSKYEGVEGVNAAFFKDFRINDSVFVDVTLLEAVDSNGWNIMRQDFCLPKLDMDFQRLLDSKKEVVYSRSVSKTNHCEPVDETCPECDILAISFAKHTIGVFHISSPDERQAVLHYNYDRSSNQKNQYSK